MSANKQHKNEDWNWHEIIAILTGVGNNITYAESYRLIRCQVSPPPVSYRFTAIYGGGGLFMVVVPPHEPPGVRTLLFWHSVLRLTGTAFPQALTPSRM